MTNANVMALGVQAVAPVKGGKGLGSALDSSSKGKFDEALGRLQQEVQDELASTGKDETPQDMEARDGGNGREGVPHSSLAMVMSLPVQQLPDEKVQIEAPAAVAELSGSILTSGDLIEEKNVSAREEKNLRSLLPQSDEAKVRNRDFLAMLSGDLTSSQREEAKARLKAALQGGQAEEGPQAVGTEQPYSTQERAGQGTAVASAAEGQQKAGALQQNLWQLGTPLAAREPTDPLALALRQTARNAMQQLPAEADDHRSWQEGTEVSGGLRQPFGQVPQGSPLGLHLRQQAAPAMETPEQSLRQVPETVDGQASPQEAIPASSAEAPVMANRQAAAPIQQAPEAAEFLTATRNSNQEAMPASGAEAPVMSNRQAAAPVQQAPEVAEFLTAARNSNQEAMPASGTEASVISNRQAAAPVRQTAEAVELPSGPKEEMPASSAEPTVMTYRQTARQPRQVLETPEVPAPQEPVTVLKDKEPVGMTYQQVVRNQQAVEASDIEFESRQPQMMAAAAERAAVRQESGQSVLGNDLPVEQPEARPLRAMQGQEARGEGSFGQGGEGGSQSFQGEMAAASMEADEAAAPLTMPQNAGAVQAGSFQQHLQEAAPVDSSQAPPAAQTDYEVPRQIVEQARLIRSGESTEMVIHLKPEHLGDLTLKISVTEGGAVTASFHSDNAQVRTIIENSLVQLRQELSDQGLKVDSVEVFSGLPDGQLPQGQGQQAWQQGRERRFNGDRQPEDYAEEADDLAAAAISQSQESLAEDGVDYRV